MVRAVDRAHGREAGVVDQDVDGQASLLDQGGELAARARIGQVGRHHLGSHAVCVCDLVRQRLQPVFAPCHQREAVPAPRELAGDLGADARRRAGDEGGGVVLRGWQCHETDRRGPAATGASAAVATRNTTHGSQEDEVRVTSPRPTRTYAKNPVRVGFTWSQPRQILVRSERQLEHPPLPRVKGAADGIDKLDRGGRSAGLNRRHRCRLRWRTRSQPARSEAWRTNRGRARAGACAGRPTRRPPHLLRRRLAPERLPQEENESLRE